MNGKLEFDQGKYHNPLYNDLMKKLVQIRAEFPKTKDVQARKEMAKEEFDAWVGYLDGRRNELPKPDFHIDEKDQSLLKENFDRFKVRIAYLLNFLKGPQDSSYCKRRHD